MIRNQVNYFMSLHATGKSLNILEDHHNNKKLVQLSDSEMREANKKLFKLNEITVPASQVRSTSLEEIDKLKIDEVE